MDARRRRLFVAVRLLGYPRGGMVDIHCHILPGLDDGPPTAEISEAMAEMAVEEGVTHIIATPHANSHYAFDPRRIAERRAELAARMGERLVLATGCDFHMSFENLRAVRQDSARFTLNQKNFLLVEFSDHAIPPSLDDELLQLRLAEITPIITHPERNPLLRGQPERLYRWIRQGCYVQATAGSFLGNFGPVAKQAAEKWLDEDAIHFVASDAHNLGARPLRLKPAFEAVSGRRGRRVAQALFQENPLAAFEGRPLPYVPGLRGDLGAAPEEGLAPRKKRFWFF